jgi:hypothetical protein
MKLSHRIMRIALVRFRVSQHLGSRLEGLKKYLSDAPFVMFSGRTRGGYDWITCQAFLSEEMADEESDIFRICSATFFRLMRSMILFLLEKHLFKP